MINGFEEIKTIEDNYRDLKKKTTNDPYMHLFETLHFKAVEKCLSTDSLIRGRLGITVGANGAGYYLEYKSPSGDKLKKYIPEQEFIMIGLTILDREQFDEIWKQGKKK